MSTSFAASWLTRDPRALAFLPDGFRDPSRRLATVERAHPVPPAVVDALRRRSRGAAAQANLARLQQSGALAVVTGQQVGLFLGPLYTVYKAAAAVVAARALEAETGRPCVPVFWLQTEDHDLPEIDHCLVPRPSGEVLRLSLDLPPGRVPVSQVRVGNQVTAAHAALRAELGHHPHAAEFLDLLERAYRPDATLTDAFTDVLGALMEDAGLLFLDPRDPALAALAAPVHRRAIVEAVPIAEELTRRAAALLEAGFPEQVHVRADSPLSFFSPDGREGARYRLEPAAPDAWTLVGAESKRTVTTADLLHALETDPARFTTSALLRPILQDTLLPTAAYVGGPGEIAYFAQLAPLYARFHLPMPLVVPRARFRILDDRVRSLLDKLGLVPADVELPREPLLARLCAHRALPEQTAPALLRERLHAVLHQELSQLHAPLESADPSLGKAVVRTEETLRDAVDHLLAKYERALTQRDSGTVASLDRLRALLLPGGVPQERVHGLPSYACRYGGRTFVNQVLAACVPFSGDLKDLTP